MPICIECRHPVETLWTEYSGAAGAKGHNIRLTVCRACGNFCDKYVEHDFVVMFIDLVLIKPQVSIYPPPRLAISPTPRVSVFGEETVGRGWLANRVGVRWG